MITTSGKPIKEYTSLTPGCRNRHQKSHMFHKYHVSFAKRSVFYSTTKFIYMYFVYCNEDLNIHRLSLSWLNRLDDENAGHLGRLQLWFFTTGTCFISQLSFTHGCSVELRHGHGLVGARLFHLRGIAAELEKSVKDRVADVVASGRAVTVEDWKDLIHHISDALKPEVD